MKELNVYLSMKSLTSWPMQSKVSITRRKVQSYWSNRWRRAVKILQGAMMARPRNSTIGSIMRSND